METKEDLVNAIKKWIKLDNEIKHLQKELKKRNQEKKNMSKELIGTMQENKIDCFDLKDGKISYSKKNIKKPLNKTMLLNILSKYYDGDMLKASELNNYINENREEVVKENIIRKTTKTKLQEE